MSDELQRLRERIAAGAATVEERDQLAELLARAIRQRSHPQPEPIEGLLAELRTVADGGMERRVCADALAGALLDAQIRAFERRDASDAWGRLDEIRARLLSGQTPDVLADRLAAALFNAHRGGELLDDAPMRLAALEELRTRAYADPPVLPCRIALAELLADAITLGCRRSDGGRVERDVAELEALWAPSCADPPGGRQIEVGRELGRALRELVLAGARDSGLVLPQLEAMVALIGPSPGDPLELRLAEVLVLAHARALRGEDEHGAEVLRERLRVLSQRGGGEAGAPVIALLREYGKALHDAAVLAAIASPVSGFDPSEDPRGRPSEGPSFDHSARALRELRTLVDQHPSDPELNGQLMSALFQVHRSAIEHDDQNAAERLLAEADTLLEDDEGQRLAPGAERVVLGSARANLRAQRARLELRLDHLRILLATHAHAGDHGDWLRAEHLLGRARQLVDRAKAPVEMVEVLGQMLVNAHVDAGARASEHATGEQPLRARTLLLELRELARANPHSNALQLHLATALFNAHVAAGRRETVVQAERLLDELDQLHRDHPALLELRRRLVMALVNHQGDDLERHDWVHASQRLDRIRELVRSSDADDHLRLQLAMALGNTLAHVDDPECREHPARVVHELRILAARDDASDTLRTLVLDELSDRFAPRQ